MGVMGGAGVENRGRAAAREAGTEEVHQILKSILIIFFTKDLDVNLIRILSFLLKKIVLPSLGHFYTIGRFFWRLT